MFDNEQSKSSRFLDTVSDASASHPIKGTTPMAQHTGKVNWFNNAKGYGFLSVEGQPDVFCHYSAIQAEGKYRSLKEGQTVEFDIVKDPTGRPLAAMVIPGK